MFSSPSIKKLSWLLFLFLILFFSFLPSAFSEENNFSKIRIGFTAVTIKSLVDINKPFSEYIGKKLGIPSVSINATLYSDMSRMLKNNEVDIAYVCGAPYVIDHDSFGEELLAVPVPAFSSGRPTYKSYIIVHKNSPFQKLEDLKKARYAFSDPLSNSGKLIPTYLLAKKGYKVDNYFHSYIYTYSHTNSIEAVAVGLVDGASVDSYIWDLHQKIDPGYSRKTKIIHRSRDFSFTPFVIRKSLAPAIKEKIRKVFLNMHLDPKGKDILNRLYLDRFVPLEDKDYDPIREMITYIDLFNQELLP